MISKYTYTQPFIIIILFIFYAAIDVPDRHTIRIDMINMDIDISELTIALPDSIIFKRNPILIPKDPVNLGMVNHMLDGLSIPL